MSRFKFKGMGAPYKISEIEVQNILDLLINGATDEDVLEEFNISSGTLRKIKLGLDRFHFLLGTAKYNSFLKINKLRNELKEVNALKKKQLPVVKKRLSEKKIHCLFTDLINGVKNKEILKKYNISISTLYNIRHGRSAFGWVLKMDYYKEYLSTKMTQKKVDNIQSDYKNGCTIFQLTQKYKFSKSIIFNAINYPHKLKLYEEV